MPNSTDLHAAIPVTRFGMGARPGEIASAAQDPRGWLKAQIRRAGADQPALDGAALPTVHERVMDLVAFRDQVKAAGADMDARKMAAQALNARNIDEMLARAQLAATTPAGFRERWTLFWSNHFTVAAKNQQVAVDAGPFEREAVRPHVFGRFEALLVESTAPGGSTTAPPRP